MGVVGTLVILLLSSLSLALIKILHKLLWTPIRIQYQIGSQGIKGPSYRFIYGNAKEILSMRKESMSKPMELSHDIFSKVQPHIHSWINKYGKNFLQWYGPQAQIVISDTQLITEILNNRDKAYRKPEMQLFVKKLLGDGLVSAEGEKWVKLRKLANFAFHSESLKSMTPAMIATAEMMLERWKHHEGKEIEVFEEFRLLTSEVISRTAFGSSYLEGKNIFEMLMKLSLLTSRNFFKVRFPGISKIFKTSDEIESEQLEKGIHNAITEIIKKREEKVMTGEEDSFGSDFLGLLLKAKHDPDVNQRISTEDVVDECKTFYLAGQETTNTWLTWTVLLLAIHTDWQEEARKEVLKLFAKQNPNSDGIAKLKTMTMIINESLRLYPPVIGIIRKVEREIRLGNVILPANLRLNISSLVIHHDPQIWGLVYVTVDKSQIWGDDAHHFKPERFAEGVAKATNNNIAAFLPFGMGARTCVGLNFANNEAKIALAMILQRYSFTLSPAYVHSPFQHITVRPQHGVQIILHPL